MPVFCAHQPQGRQREVPRNRYHRWRNPGVSPGDLQSPGGGFVSACIAGAAGLGQNASRAYTRIPGRWGPAVHWGAAMHTSPTLHCNPCKAGLRHPNIMHGGGLLMCQETVGHQASAVPAGAGKVASVLAEATTCLQSGVELRMPDEKYVNQYDLRPGAFNQAANDPDVAKQMDDCIGDWCNKASTAGIIGCHSSSWQLTLDSSH
eukprot:GHUV01035341.1.p1 GENE.GHUV01035341.1~~GHUV01035341.1.p1  ORF type:complete len:205 (-),score=35.98 GHUV01035341.1:579-1193(-)